MTKTAINWMAAEKVADGLGIHTRQPVKKRDTEAGREWALRMASSHEVYAGNAPRAASYVELAVLLLGHEEPPPTLAEKGDSS